MPLFITNVIFHSQLIYGAIENEVKRLNSGRNEIEDVKILNTTTLDTNFIQEKWPLPVHCSFLAR